MLKLGKVAMLPATLGLVAVLGFGASATAVAESEESASSGAVLEEIIVTARKREESVQEVPVAITALSGELRNSSIRDLSDVNGFAPNVQIDSDPGRTGGASITIRGISPTRTDDNSLDSPIAVTIDGIFLGTLSGQVIENFDLERIEILRGPQGTLFGKNTVGGVVNVVRSRPTGEIGARIKGTVGKWGQRELRAVVNAPVFEDTLAAKVFYTTIEGDGFLYNTNLQDDFPRKDYANYGLTLLATPNDRFEALFTVETYTDDSDIRTPTHGYNLPPGLAEPPNDAASPDLSYGHLGCYGGHTECRTDLSIAGKETTMDFNGPASFDVDAYTLNMNFDLNDQLRVVSVTGYREMVEDRLIDFDGAKGNYITIERDNDYEQFSQELRVEFTNERLSLVGGAYYWRSEFEQDWVTGGSFWYSLFGGVVSNPALLGACWAGAFAPIACDTGAPADDPGWQGPELTQLLYEDQVTKSIAFFAQADYEIMPNLNLTVGLRWTEEKKDFVGAQSYLAPVSRAYVHNHPAFADLSQKWDEISPKFGLSYQWDDILFYASYSEGFHSGGFFGVNQNTRDFERDQYDPEFANSWEAGVKSQLLDNRLQLNGAFFYNDFDDKQEQAVQLDPDTKTVATVFSNVAKAVYWGIELEAQFVVNENVSLFASYGYLDADYKDFFTDINPNDDGLGQNIEDASHLIPRNAPDNTYGFGGTVTVPAGPGYFELYAKYNFVDAIETSLVNAEFGHLPSRKFVNANASYNWRNMTVTLYGRNLNDEVYETYGHIGGGSPEFHLFGVSTVTPGRSWGVEFEMEL